jgi:hypothetical protein
MNWKDYADKPYLQDEESWGSAILEGCLCAVLLFAWVVLIILYSFV